MADNTLIEWARNRDGSKGKTWNIVIGCEPVSEECDDCYAIVQSHIRAANPHPAVAAAFAGLTVRTPEGVKWTGRVNILEERLPQPFSVRKPTTWFVNSLSDLFHKSVPEWFIIDAFAVMALTSWHTYIILTKRPPRMRAMLRRADFWYKVGRQARHLGYGNHRVSTTLSDGQRVYDLSTWENRRSLPNVILGVSAGSQKWAKNRIPVLLDTPAEIRMVSAEPLIGPLDLTPWLDKGLHWVVTGGESGPTPRPAHVDWFRVVRDQCHAAGVAYFHKQHGGHTLVTDAPAPGDVWVAWDGSHRDWEPGDGYTRRAGSEYRNGTAVLVRKVGKKAAGHLLDGREWLGLPLLGGEEWLQIPKQEVPA